MTSIASVHMYGFYHMGDVLLENNRTQDIGRFGVYSPIDFKEKKKMQVRKTLHRGTRQSTMVFTGRFGRSYSHMAFSIH